LTLVGQTAAAWGISRCCWWLEHASRIVVQPRPCFIAHGGSYRDIGWDCARSL
jgi:hypothetical protein